MFAVKRVHEVTRTREPLTGCSVSDPCCPCSLGQLSIQFALAAGGEHFRSFTDGSNGE